MKALRKYMTIAFVLIASIVFGQQTPAPAQTDVYTIVGATAHIGDGTVIENSILIIEDGKISVCADLSLIHI